MVDQKANNQQKLKKCTVTVKRCKKINRYSKEIVLVRGLIVTKSRITCVRTGLFNFTTSKGNLSMSSGGFHRFKGPQDFVIFQPITGQPDLVFFRTVLWLVKIWKNHVDPRIVGRHLEIVIHWVANSQPCFVEFSPYTPYFRQGRRETTNQYFDMLSKLKMNR